MLRSAYDVQLDFAVSSGLRSQVIWDSLNESQAYILKEKIKTLMPDNNVKRNKIAEMDKLRNFVFDNVWRQRKYTNRTLLSAIIYIMVVGDEQDADRALLSSNYSLHPIFRTRKCMNDEMSSGCCMIFIDEFGRVYKNWSSFVRNNILPKGMMIAPINGIYTFSEDNTVQLECRLTPAATVKRKVRNVSDAVSSASGVLATVPIAAALAFPVSGPVIAAASAMCLATAAYTTVRSAMQLTDRSLHCQSIGLNDRESRGNWLGLASGAVGLGATGATKALSFVSRAGQEISLGAKIAAGGLNVSSMLLSGTGAMNSVYDIFLKINDDDKILGMDLLHLSASLLIFTHSINNLKIISRLSTNPQAFNLRRLLSQEVRATIEKLSLRTSSAPINGSSKTCRFDIIRTVNDIPFKDTLVTLDRLNRHLNGSRGVLQTIGGGIERALGRTVPNLIMHMANGERPEMIFEILSQEFGLKFVDHIMNASSLLDVLNAMLKYLSEETFHFLLNLAQTFLNEYVDQFQNELQTFVASETVVYKIFMQCIENYSSLNYNFLEGKTAEILKSVESYFESLNPVNYANKRQNCKYCKGYFYLSDI